MDSWEPVIAFAATTYGFVGSSASLLQARAVRRRGDADSVSLGFLLLHGGGYALWFLYGASISSTPIMLVDGIGFITAGVTINVTLAMRRRTAQRSALASADPSPANVTRSRGRAGTHPSRSVVRVAWLTCSRFAGSPTRWVASTRHATPRPRLSRVATGSSSASAVTSGRLI